MRDRRAAAPSAAFRWAFPGRVAVDLIRPADSLLPGQVPADDARWAAVGHPVFAGAGRVTSVLGMGHEREHGCRCVHEAARRAGCVFVHS